MKRMIFSATLLLLASQSPIAMAGKLDFVAEAAKGERGVANGSITVMTTTDTLESVNVRLNAFNVIPGTTNPTDLGSINPLTDTTNRFRQDVTQADSTIASNFGTGPFAYFDRQDGSGPAGLGVAQQLTVTSNSFYLGNKATNSGDDNAGEVTGGDEVLVLELVDGLGNSLTGLQIDELTFRNSTHKVLATGSLIAVSTGGAWTNMVVEAGGKLTGLGVLGGYLALANVDAEFYLSSMTFGPEAAPNPVPEPTSLALFSFGAFGVLARFRRDKRA